MNQKKIIAILGATGAQGGGLAHAILDDPNSEFAVRALTRNINSEKSEALRKKGAEVVAADVDDQESLEKAFEGAYGAFCVTFFWDHMSPEKEQAQAQAMANAAAKSGLKHVIWSTFEDTRNWVPLDDDRMPTLQGKYKVPHFDAKGEANAYFTDAGVPVTFMYTSFYWDNFINFGMGPQKGPDGKLAITLPMGDKKFPAMAASDIGKCAYGVYKAGSEYIGKTIGVAGEHISGQEMADSLSKAFGQDIGYNAIPPGVYRSFGFPGADDMGNMFQFKHDFNEDYCGIRNIDRSRELNPVLMNFNAWLEQNKSRIPMG